MHLVLLIFGWYISNFSTKAILYKNGELQVTEDITVDFDSEWHHGIFRVIPTTFRGHSIHFKLIQVEGDFGGAIPYRAYKRFNTITIKIGDPGKTVSGTHSYRIIYRVRNVVIDEDTIQVLRWNVTGNAWPVPIRKASFLFKVSGMSNPSSYKCYTGPRFSTNQNCEVNTYGNIIEVNTVSYLPPGSGLTVEMNFPPGSISIPSRLTILIWELSKYKLMVIPVITLIFMIGLWYRSGRDEGGGPIVPTYYPPQNLNPAEAGTIYDEKLDPSDVSGLLLHLAFKGYIKIIESDRDEYVIVKEKDWHNDTTLKPHERYLLESIFTVGTIVQFMDGMEAVSVSTLKKKFYRNYAMFKKMVYHELTRKGYFVGNPETVRLRIAQIGGTVFMLGAFFGRFLALWLNDSPISAFSLLFSGIIIIFFSSAMPRKTRKGARIARLIRGFHDFIKRAEKDRIRRLAEQEPEAFKTILPYAVSFREEEKWNEVFYELSTKIEPSGQVRVSSLSHFNSFLGHEMLTTPRGSSFRGISTSGGFSGGGAGGGGGGAW